MLASSSEKLTFQSPEIWVYLLGLSVLLGIALRRVSAKQQPLSDELFSKSVAIEYVQSGVAWVATGADLIRAQNLGNFSPDESRLHRTICSLS